MRDIVIATNYDDWEGLYIDGVLITQQHKLRIEDVLDALEISYSEIDASGYINKHFSLPAALKELDDEE